MYFQRCIIDDVDDIEGWSQTRVARENSACFRAKCVNISKTVEIKNTPKVTTMPLAYTLSVGTRVDDLYLG